MGFVAGGAIQIPEVGEKITQDSQKKQQFDKRAVTVAKEKVFSPGKKF